VPVLSVDVTQHTQIHNHRHHRHCVTYSLHQFQHKLQVYQHLLATFQTSGQTE